MLASAVYTKNDLYYVKPQSSFRIKFTLCQFFSKICCKSLDSRRNQKIE